MNQGGSIVLCLNKSTIISEFVRQLYCYCRYENAWFLNSRPGICAVFTPENLKVGILKLDLKLYCVFVPNKVCKMKELDIHIVLHS